MELILALAVAAVHSELRMYGKCPSSLTIDWIYDGRTIWIHDIPEIW